MEGRARLEGVVKHKSLAFLLDFDERSKKNRKKAKAKKVEPEV